jgi:hypothetical protein
MDKAMMAALRMDQEILEAMTGEEQPLFFLDADGNIIIDCERAADDAEVQP